MTEQQTILESTYIKDYSPGQEYIGFLAVRKASPDKTNGGTGKPFLNATLSDGDDDYNAKQWNYDGPSPAENTIIKVQAMVETYLGKPQLKIIRWRPAEEGECSQRFIPVCPRSINEMADELHQNIISINHSGLQELVTDLINAYREDFISCPGAMKHHHAYIGGLLEHTLGVAAIASKLALGEEVDKDLLLAGAILHDTGKIWECDWTGHAITMKTEGRFIGHICKGITLIENWTMRCPGVVDRETLNLLLHMIVSHHGKLEWGSPVEPITKEAVILHQADYIDTNLWKINKAEADTEPGTWTKKIYGVNKEFYVPSRDSQELEPAATSGL